MFIESTSVAQHRNGNRGKTHCKHGHPFDEVNTYVSKTGGRHCRACHRARELEKIQTTGGKLKNVERSRAWREANPERYKEFQRNRRRTIFTWLTEYKRSHGCYLCSESEPVSLDFHHRDSTKKKFNIGISWHAVSRKRLEAEVEKCDVICANCHRKLTAAERAASLEEKVG